MHAAIIKLNALPNPVRSTTKHHDFFAISRRRLAFLFVRRVKIGGVGGEFSRTRIDPLINGTDVVLMTQLADFTFDGIKQKGKATIGKAASLEL